MKKEKIIKRVEYLTDQVLVLSDHVITLGEIVKKLYERLKHEPLLEEESNQATVYRSLLNNDGLKNMSFVLGKFNCHIRILPSNTWEWEVRELATSLERGKSSSCMSAVIQCLSYYQVYRDTKPVDEQSTIEKCHPNDTKPVYEHWPSPGNDTKQVYEPWGAPSPGNGI